MGDKRYAVVGTPTDCVLMAIYELMPDDRPTVLLSGINRGANLAEDMTYSGTIAAAMEGTLLGIRSIALSQVFAMRGEALWATAEAHAPDVIRTLMGMPEWPANTLINVNFPDALPEAVSGVRVTSQGQRPPGSFTIDGRVDTRHVPYFWVEISYKDGEKHGGDRSSRDPRERDLRDADPARHDQSCVARPLDGGVLVVIPILRGPYVSQPERRLTPLGALTILRRQF